MSRSCSARLTVALLIYEEERFIVVMVLERCRLHGAAAVAADDDYDESLGPPWSCVCTP